jgi:mannose-6-phosphate isomerase-like protein (cupin superfamily)
MTSGSGDTPSCCILAADRGFGEPHGVRRIAGQDLDVEFVRLAASDVLDRPAGADAGEEVAAVLEGSWHVGCGEEEYWLSPGEGIIIPPGEGSRWRSDTGGLLYRVIVRVPVP